MASHIWLRTILIVIKETRCRHIGYSLQLAQRVILYASSHRQNNAYHGLCYTSRGTLAGTRNSWMGQPRRIDPTTDRTMSESSYHGATSRSSAHRCITKPARFLFLWLEKERLFLINDALNTFYLRLYGVRHMVKDHSDSEKGNPLPPHRLILSINSKGSFICTIPQTG